VKGLSHRAPHLSTSIFPEGLHLGLRGHVRCLFITAILLITHIRLVTLLRYGVSLVVKGCFESGHSCHDLHTCESRRGRCPEKDGEHWTPL